MQINYIAVRGFGVNNYVQGVSEWFPKGKIKEIEKETEKRRNKK